MSLYSTGSSWRFPSYNVRGFDSKMGSEIDFGELSNDQNFQQRILGFKTGLEKASEMLETFFSNYNYDELSLEDKIRYDLFLAFAINSYFWMYLRIRGVDPSQHDIRSQINRVREYMNKSKQMYEKKTLMPKVDQGAAKRFVRSGLWDPEHAGKSKSIRTDGSHSLKRKRDDTND